MLKQIPITKNPIILRTDFSSQSIWEKTLDAIQMPYGDYEVGMEYIEEIEYKGIPKEQLIQLVPESYNHNFIIVFDRHTVTMPELPLLVIDLLEEPGRDFRAERTIAGFQGRCPSVW